MRALQDLRIDRHDDERSLPHARPRWPWIAGPAVLAVGGMLAWSVHGPQAESPAVTVAAQPAVAMAAPPSSAPRHSVLDASGYVVARRHATLSAKVTGRLTAVNFNEGDHVVEGAVIAMLDRTQAEAVLAEAAAEVALAAATLEAARVALANADAGFDRNQRQREQGLISAQAFDVAKGEYDALRTGIAVARRGLEVARAQHLVRQRELDDTVIRAPFSGIITVKAAQPGEIVSPMSAGGGFTRTGICTLVDMDSLELDVDVSESFIDRLTVDQPARVTLNAFPDRPVDARVVAIVPTADRSKATVKVRVQFLDKDPRILPEMGAKVSFL